MRTEDILNSIDSGELSSKTGTVHKSLPGLSIEDIQSLKLQGNPVAALAGETTDKEYVELQRHRNVISNSILSGLHSCPRRLLLEKISANERSGSEIVASLNLDFVFGHSVGAGVQALFAFEQLDYALYAAFLSWKAPWEFGHEDFYRRKNKSIEKAVIAIESFKYFRDDALDEWEIYRLADGRPAIELSFCVDLGKTKYFGHIDLVLKNRRTGKIAVGEVKTSGFSNPDEALYRNSGQALGYALILDSIVGVDADYDVLYVVYSASSTEWTLFPFAHSVSSKLEWVQDRLIDSGHLEQYFKLEHFPKNGASCMQFNRRCQFYGSCGLVDKEAMRNLPIAEGREYPVDYVFNLKELLNRQKENVA